MHDKKPRKPFVPPPRGDSLRHEIIGLLKHHELSAKELSAEVRIPEKEILEHLEHIRLGREGDHLQIIPACCKKCGFVFKKRERLTSPGKCPICSCENIQDPRFTLS